jgi:hypothetical protein
VVGSIGVVIAMQIRTPAPSSSAIAARRMVEHGVQDAPP